MAQLFMALASCGARPTTSVHTMRPSIPKKCESAAQPLVVAVLQTIANRLERPVDQVTPAVLAHQEGRVAEAQTDRLRERHPPLGLVAIGHSVERGFGPVDALHGVQSDVVSREQVLGPGDLPVEGGLDEKRVDRGEVAVGSRARDQRLRGDLG